jgi:hypothetical protein
VIDTSYFTIEEECDVVERIVRYWGDNKKKMEKV